MSFAYSVYPTVTGHGGDDLEPHSFIVFADDPGFTGKVELTENVEAVWLMSSVSPVPTSFIREMQAAR